MLQEDYTRQMDRAIPTKKHAIPLIALLYQGENTMYAIHRHSPHGEREILARYATKREANTALRKLCKGMEYIPSPNLTSLPSPKDVKPYKDLYDPWGGRVHRLKDMPLTACNGWYIYTVWQG